MVRRREVDDRVWTRFDASPDWDRALHNDEVKLYRWRGVPARADAPIGAGRPATSRHATTGRRAAT
jgi:hypothetical protein